MDERLPEYLDDKARGVPKEMVLATAIECPRALLEEDDKYNNLVLVGFF